MAAGDTFPPEGKTYTDGMTGAAVRQLTDWRAHNHHLYFTNSGLWDGGRRMLFGSHRHNRENLYSLELATGRITQLTDFGGDEAPHLLQTFLNPTKDEAFFFCGQELRALDLRSLAQRTLFCVPEGYRPGNVSCTADGRTLCANTAQDLVGRFRLDLQHGYVGFVETFEARPHCRIFAVPVAGGEARVLHEQRLWLGHVNTSPTMPDALTICHEGPWDRLQRLWAARVSTGEVWPLRPQAPPEAIGHEYWFADGRRVGYHGWKDPQTHLFGHVRWDGSDLREYAWRGRSMHFHSLDETLVVGDGGRDCPFLLLWRLAGDAYEGPRRLAQHRGSFHTQIQHVHPRMFVDLDGKTRVVYSGDHNGYGNVFLVEVGDFDALPVHEPKD